MLYTNIYIYIIYIYIYTYIHIYKCISSGITREITNLRKKERQTIVEN